MLDQWQELIKNLEEALSETPGSVTLRRQLGDALFQVNDYRRAEEELKRALHYRPDDSRTIISLAKLYLILGKNGAASVLLESQLQKQDVDQQIIQLYEEINKDEKSHSSQLIASESTPELEKIKTTISKPDDKQVALEIEHPIFNFSSVGGMARVKEEINIKIILPMTNQDLYAAYGKKAGGGILLYGPPGCGKTHLARATAGQINANFITVGLNDILDMYLGQSEQKLHQLFEQARQHKPCVLFFDEVDALGANRGDLRKQAGRTIVNQFLMELDGMNANNDNVLVLAATNAPWYLDQAFRRPGRFDRIIFVEPPDQAARVEILDIMLNNKPIENIDFEKVAKALNHYSGADIQALIDMTVEQKLRLAMQQGRQLPIMTKDLLSNTKKVKPSTKEWFTTAKNYAVYANESGLYDDILNYLGMT